MNVPKIYIIIGVAVGLLLVIIIAIATMSNQQQPDQQTQTPNESTNLGQNSTPDNEASSDSRNSNESDSYEIISTNPTDKSVNIGETDRITISYSTSLSSDDLDISIGPPTEISWETNGSDLIIRPDTPFSTGTQYTITIRYPNNEQLPDFLSFTTAGPTPSVIVIEPPPEFENLDEQLRLQQEETPKLYLYNNLPHEGRSFLLEGEMVSISPKEYIFTVSVKTNRSEAETDILSYLESEGFTENQIQDITSDFQFQEMSPQEQAVSNLEDELPYEGEYFSLEHNGTQFVLAIDSGNQEEALQEFQEYLEENDIGNQSWLDSLKLETF
jgi:hypothetical protein